MKDSSSNSSPPRKLNAMPHPSLIFGRNGESSSLSWYWPGAIPARSIVLIEGRKATGKSLCAAAIAAAVTGGRALPDWCGPTGDTVLWVAAEDHYDEIVIPRLDWAGAVIHRVVRWEIPTPSGTRRRPGIPGDLPELEEILLGSDISLVVLDPYISLASPSLDMRSEQGARAYLDPVADICRRYDVVCLAIRHLRKGRGGDAREAGLGSVAVSNAARSILRCDEHPHQRGRFVMSVVACNYGARAATREYRLEHADEGRPRIEWCGTNDLDADAIAEGRGDEGERGEWSDAERLLAELIGSGWVRVSIVTHEADLASVPLRVLRRAKERLGVRSRRVALGAEGHWEWGPPAKGWPATFSAPPEPPPAEQGAAAPRPRRRKKKREIPE